MVKRLRDENAPKKPMTAYFRWMKKNRRRVVQSMPIGYSLKQLTGKMSKMWAALSDKEKAKWTEKSKKEMKVYEKLVAAYRHTSNYKMFLKKKQEYTISKTGKFRKDPNRPKAPSTAYFLFMADKREETKKNFPALNHKQLISKLAELWNKLSDEMKQPYANKAEETKKQWHSDVEAYEKTDKFKKYMEEKRNFIESQKAAKTAGGKHSAAKTAAGESKVAKKLKGSRKPKKRVSKKKQSKKATSSKTRKKTPRAKKVKKSTKLKAK